MNPTFMRLWLQHQQSKAQGAGGLATPPGARVPDAMPAAPNLTGLGSSIAGDVGNAVTSTLSRYPQMHGSPDKGGQAGAFADKARSAAEALPQDNLGPGPSPNAQGPAEGSLEWFDKASPTELRAHAAKVRGMVKIGS